jgi:uncharacterized membrane protein
MRSSLTRHSSCCFGAIAAGLGFWRRAAFLRWQALVLLAMAIAKVFLSDMSDD